MDNKIVLKSINLHVGGYGENKGRLIGSVKFESGFGEIAIKPSPETQVKIIDAFAEEIIAATASAAAGMRESIQESVGMLIEAKAKDTPKLEGIKDTAIDADFDGVPF